MERQLPDWLKGYMHYTRYNEAPEMFHFWAGVGTIAGALRRKVFIDQEYFIWSPNFYIIFVGPPGVVTKSTTMRAGANLLRQVAGISFGPDSITWQALVDALEEATEGVLVKGVDFTDPNAEIVNMSCLTFASSELGTLLNPKDREMIDVLCDLWDGQDTTWRKKTRHMGDNVIENPWLNIMACTTPAWFADNLPRHMVGGGFTSRCIFVYADRKRALVPYPRDLIRKYGSELRQLKKQLVHDLEVISMLKGEYELSPEAKEFGEQWYVEQYYNPPADLKGNAQFSGYLQRKQGHVHKLAIVLAAAHTDELIISLEDLQNAVKIVEAAEHDLPKVFRSINSSLTMEHAEAIVQAVYRHPGVLEGELYQAVFHIMNWDDFSKIVTSAVNAQLVYRVLTAGVGWQLFPKGKPGETPGIVGSTPSASEALHREGPDSSTAAAAKAEGPVQ